MPTPPRPRAVPGEDDHRPDTSGAGRGPDHDLGSLHHPEHAEPVGGYGRVGGQERQGGGSVAPPLAPLGVREGEQGAPVGALAPTPPVQVEHRQPGPDHEELEVGEHVPVAPA